MDLSTKSFEVTNDPRYNSQPLMNSKAKSRKGATGGISKDKLRNNKSGDQLNTSNIEELKR